MTIFGIVNEEVLIFGLVITIFELLIICLLPSDAGACDPKFNIKLFEPLIKIEPVKVAIFDGPAIPAPGGNTKLLSLLFNDVVIAFK